ncbi:type I secretion system permease/ATPase [Rhizobium leguminosarum]|uniref:type I secretion system permease/ATPase n=1 Tax=Rhizobium leguminosarum TaxID=384 RepID=UPI000DE4D2B1|nr:type I secretion system permease/ATPase [Rhizobium leguminosarum]MBY2919594.1 type I secretion system permease/ATPase [Rhizobium leguminosarum]MBY2975262.1 type I secretion system permease/ATPase [Rhizobium leguminosarum]MBY2988097.1 type I secretion system permease/ATPase [Rhizobium leguminosarum]MBY3003758.1 type I secretion system permease/ATPase [Rhizobium leguminosarum]MBY3026911.1 type I secretion system permease/ATPase [Rhizobium leguminosarum]
MNQISKQIFAAGSALDLRSGTIPSAAPSEATTTDVCISAIDEAVENLRRLSGAAASSPDGRKETSEAAANEAADTGRASATQAPLPEKTAVLEAKVGTAPPVAVAQAPATAKPAEAPAQPQIEARVAPELPTEKTELKSSPTMPFGKTIEGESGPISENDRRLRTGGGGNGKNSDPGGGGGGGGGSGGGFHKRSEPVNFAASLSRGMAAVRRNMVVVMVFTVAINVLLLAIPLYLFQISDRVLTSRSVDTLVMLSIAVIGAVLLQAFMDTVRRFILMRTAVELEVQLGAPILSAAARASLHGSGKDYQTLQDLQLLRGFLTSGTLIAFLDAPLMPFFVVVVYFVHPHLGIIIMVCCAVLFVIAYLNQKFTARQFAESNGYLSRANFHLDSMSRNSQIINAMAMIPEAVKMWGRETAGSLKSQVEAQDRNIIFSGISKACRMITQITLLGWGAHLSLSGELTGGMVIASSIISGRALAPIEGAIEGWHQFNRSAAAYGRIKGLLLNSPLNFPRLRLPNPEGRLDVERILFVPPPQKKVILNGISFSLRKGESLAIIGNSGSGKTTLGKMLVGSIVPTSGNVRLDLMDLRNWDQRQFGESIGYLPQDVQLFPGTIKANICRMRDDVDDHQIYEAAVLADVHELIAGFPQGYETIVAGDGAPLSGGQKQRIALARAFFGNPKFVVLDEPNSNLDTQGEAALAKALIHAKKQGITTVTITQRPALLQCVDKILVLKEGTVAMFGERIEVLQALSKNNGNNGQQAPRIEG